ncbi:hypothetical protein BOTBODRAFT_31490 [Botryobasidium botryosum FD-172 SS1]|uniref:Uncharacterized protein n=1 Tax=Botryobasidium botryosum (strain FD-172 SS1) TaxID=930990 RepID=A0A067MIH9_BOTB1|nr:hypothetical protein BOTBODRAFT_31490 [Botryobasidium botryosum FD-172 SS1]
MIPVAFRSSLRANASRDVRLRKRAAPPLSPDASSPGQKSLWGSYKALPRATKLQLAAALAAIGLVGLYVTDEVEKSLVAGQAAIAEKEASLHSQHPSSGGPEQSSRPS